MLLLLLLLLAAFVMAAFITFIASANCWRCLLSQLFACAAAVAVVVAVGAAGEQEPRRVGAPPGESGSQLSSLELELERERVRGEARGERDLERERRVSDEPLPASSASMIELASELEARLAAPADEHAEAGRRPPRFSLRSDSTASTATGEFARLLPFESVPASASIVNGTGFVLVVLLLPLWSPAWFIPSQSRIEKSREEARG